MKTREPAGELQQQRQTQRQPAAQAVRHGAAHRASGVGIDSSERVAAQRREIEASFGSSVVQQQTVPDEEEPAQRKPTPSSRNPGNETGMPDQLKAGVESMSGMDLSDVRVHVNSAMPAQLNALAYAQGNDIHLAPGQEQHLPHEAWHVVQQRQGRVQPTLQAKGLAFNDDPSLEEEADVMGAKAAQLKDDGEARTLTKGQQAASGVAQRFVGFEYQMLHSKIAIANIKGAKPSKWEPIKDGENLEVMTTETLSAEGDVRRVVTEMAALARRVRDAVPMEEVDVGDKRITVMQPDGAGQPQVNFDLSLAALGGSFAKPLDALRRDGKFGANFPSFGWNPAESEAQVEIIQRAIELAQKVLDDKLIFQSFYGNKSNLVQWPAALFEDIRGYVVLDFSQQLQRKNKGLTKDVPLLAKTSLSALRERLITRLEDADAQLGIDTTERLDKMLASLTGQLLQHLPLGGHAKRDIAKRSGGGLYEEEKEHDPLVGRGNDRLGVLLELRRAPVIPIAQWVPFALSAFRDLGLLFAPRAAEAQKTQQSDSDNSGGDNSEDD